MDDSSCLELSSYIGELREVLPWLDRPISTFCGLIVSGGIWDGSLRASLYVPERIAERFTRPNAEWFFVVEDGGRGILRPYWYCGYLLAYIQVR